jgi:hypothetical protein
VGGHKIPLKDAKSFPQLLPERWEARYHLLGNHKELIMLWYHYLAYFFGGAFFANTFPHLINGVSGRPFQSPFAKPPGEGLSSSTVNVLWGLFNLAVAYVLILRVGKFNIHSTAQIATVGAGALVMSLMLARAFGRFHGGNLKK